MVFGWIVEMLGGKREQYEAVHRAVGFEQQLTTGLLYHAAGPSENGWRVVEVWQSQEVADQFFREHLQAALEAAGVQDLRVQAFDVADQLGRSSG